MITLPSGRVIKSDYDIPGNEELGALDVAGMAISEGTKAVKSGKAGDKPKEALEAASKGAAMGAAAGSVIPGVGTVIGGIIGGSIGALSAFLGSKDKGPPDYFGHGIGGYYGKKIRDLVFGDLARQGTKASQKELARRIATWMLRYDIKYGMVPPDTTLDTIAQVVKNQGGVSLRGKYKNKKWADGKSTSDYPPTDGLEKDFDIPLSAKWVAKIKANMPKAKVEAVSEPVGNLDTAAIKESLDSGSLSKSEIQEALKSVLSTIAEKKQAKQILLDNISKDTNKNLSSIKKTLLRNALSNEATSEHNKRNKINAIVRDNKNKQNLMLGRLSAIETALNIKKAKGQALATAFGIPKDYV